MDRFAEFSKANRRRCEARDGFNHPLGHWSTSDWMVAVLGELGEAAGVVRQLNRLRDDKTEAELRARLADELADAFTTLDLMAQSLDLDILEEAERKFKLVSEEIGYDPIRPFAPAGTVAEPDVSPPVQFEQDFLASPSQTPPKGGGSSGGGGATSSWSDSSPLVSSDSSPSSSSSDNSSSSSSDSSSSSSSSDSGAGSSSGGAD